MYMYIYIYIVVYIYIHSCVYIYIQLYIYIYIFSVPQSKTSPCRSNFASQVVTPKSILAAIPSIPFSSALSQRNLFDHAQSAAGLSNIFLCNLSLNL